MPVPAMAGLRALVQFRAFNSSLIVDLQRTAGLLGALRSVSTCLPRGHSTSREVLAAHRVTTLRGQRRFSSAEFSELDGNQVESLSSVTRIIPKTKDERMEMNQHLYKAPPDSRVLKVSILGAPNAGKSTLTNALMGWRICSVSKKVHTTKHNTKALMVEGNTQILLLDTPGLISEQEMRRHSLEPSMLSDPKTGVNNADLVLVMVDVSNKWTRNSLDREVLKLLQECTRKNVVLVLNKVDLVKCKQILLGIVRELTEGNVDGQVTHIVKRLTKPKSLEEIFRQTGKALKKMEQEETDSEEAVQKEPEPASSENDPQQQQLGPGWPYFSRIFMLSALQEDGIKELKTYILCQAKTGVWKYKPNFVTDQTPEEIAILAVREKLLDYMPKEIPYKLDLEIEFWEVDAHGVLRISILVKCPLKHQVKLVIGAQGTIVSKIAAEARQMLMNTFRCEVSLKLIVGHFRSKKK